MCVLCSSVRGQDGLCGICESDKMSVSCMKAMCNSVRNENDVYHFLFVLLRVEDACILCDSVSVKSSSFHDFYAVFILRLFFFINASNLDSDNKINPLRTTGFML